MIFEAPTTPKQRAWLRSTSVPLRSVTFCLRELDSHRIMRPVSCPCCSRRLIPPSLT